MREGRFTCHTQVGQADFKKNSTVSILYPTLVSQTSRAGGSLGLGLTAGALNPLGWSS